MSVDSLRKLKETIHIQHLTAQTPSAEEDFEVTERHGKASKWTLNSDLSHFSLVIVVSYFMSCCLILQLLFLSFIS